MSEPHFHLPPPEHCNAPMRWTGNGYRWEGAPGNGASISIHRYACTVCPSTLECVLREPDEAGAA